MEFPKSTNVTCSIFNIKRFQRVWLNWERKSLAYPDNPAPYHLLQPGSIPTTIHILCTELRRILSRYRQPYLEYLDSTRGARPVGSQTPHLLTFPHPIGFHKLVHEVGQEEGEFLCLFWQQLNMNLDSRLKFSYNTINLNKLAFNFMINSPVSCLHVTPGPCRPTQRQVNDRYIWNIKESPSPSWVAAAA